MTEIDFLPAEYWKRRASQRDQWYLLGIGAASIILLLASLVHETSKAAGVRGQLESMESEFENALGLVEQVKQLDDQRRPLALDAKFHTLLRARPSMSRAMVALATSCPARLTLNSIRVKTAMVAKSDPKAAPRATRTIPTNPTRPSAPVDSTVEQLEQFATRRQSSRVAIELTGVAESDLELAEFMERLENAGCFTEVSLGTAADLPSTSHSELREFKIQCRLVEVF
jgi:Tfp pilus assembly protein PilN